MSGVHGSNGTKGSVYVPQDPGTHKIVSEDPKRKSIDHSSSELPLETHSSSVALEVLSQSQTPNHPPDYSLKKQSLSGEVKGSGKEIWPENISDPRIGKMDIEVKELYTRLDEFKEEFNKKFGKDVRDLTSAKTDITVTQIFRNFFTRMTSFTSKKEKAEKFEEITKFKDDYKDIKVEIEKKYKELKEAIPDSPAKKYMFEKLDTNMGEQLTKVNTMLENCDKLLEKNKPIEKKLPVPNKPNLESSVFINPAAVKTFQDIIDKKQKLLENLNHDSTEYRVKLIELEDNQKDLKKFQNALELVLKNLSIDATWPSKSSDLKLLSELETTLNKACNNLVKSLQGENKDKTEIVTCLRNIQKASHELKQQQEHLFIKLFNESPKKSQKIFQRTEKLLGDYAIPLNYKVALIQFINVNQDLFANKILPLAEASKKDNLQILANKKIPKIDVKLDEMVNSVFSSSNMDKLPDKGRVFGVFFVGFFKAKIGTGINIQFVSDSLGIALGGELVTMDTELKRFLGVIENQKFLADGLSDSEKSLAQQGYINWVDYGLQIKNEWSVDQGIQWTGLFQLKQKDGSYKLYKSEQAKISFGDIPKDDYSLAWSLVTYTLRSQEPLNVENFVKFRELLPKDDQEAKVKFKEILAKLQSGGLSEFRNTIELECLRAQVQ